VIDYTWKGAKEMENLILKSISVENFASFAEPIIFTTESDFSKKEHLDNTFACGDSRFNKVSFLYGANGSGKTFFCKILREIQRLLLVSPLAATDAAQLLSIPQLKEMDTPVKTFAFDTSFQEKPTKFAIELIIDGTTYRYAFSVKGKEVVYELLTKKHRRTEKLLERTSSSFKDITLRSDLKGFDAAKHTVKAEALCLPVAGMLNTPLASKIVAAISGINVINMAAGRLDPVNPKETFSEERLRKYISIIKKADPTLRDIKVSFEEEEVARQRVSSDDFENRELIAKRTKVGVDSRHAVYENGEETTSAPLSFFADESLGTVKLFTALPYLFDVLEKGGILIIDELENGLHLSLAKEIIELFTSEGSNPHHAQLICTSHQPLLVDGNYRRDQVWITAKDSCGKSVLHRMSDLKTSRAKVNLANRILEGAFGCNPDLFFDNNT
jgi:hypothetical protein